MSNELTLHARLTTDMRFSAETASGHHLLLDTLSQNSIQSSGPSPMEMLLAALAGCSGISMLSLLHKQRQNIARYEIHVYGKQAETHPHVFVEIRVQHVFTGHTLQKEAVARALQLTEERYCSVSVMLSKATNLQQTFEIVDESTS